VPLTIETCSEAFCNNMQRVIGWNFEGPPAWWRIFTTFGTGLAYFDWLRAMPEYEGVNVAQREAWFSLFNQADQKVAEAGRRVMHSTQPITPSVPERSITIPTNVGTDYQSQTANYMQSLRLMREGLGGEPGWEPDRSEGRQS
jgi:hypothetical protein